MNTVRNKTDDTQAKPARKKSPPLHSSVKTIVSTRANMTQVALRWFTVLASSLVVVQVGTGIDLLQRGVSPEFLWWVLILGTILVAAISSGLATGQSMATQSLTERKLRKLAQESWNELGVMRIRDRAGAMLDVSTNGAMRAARYRGGFLSASLASLSAPLIVCLTMGFALSWPVAGFMSLIVLVGPFLVRAFQMSTKAAGERFRISQMFLRSSFLEGISALESLVYAGAGGSYARRLAAASEVHRRKIMSLLAGNQLLLFFMDIVFSMAAFLLATLLAVQRLESGQFTVGQGFTLLLLTVIMVDPVDLIGQFFYIGIGGRATQRQFSALSYEADAAKASRVAQGPQGPSETGVAISFDQVDAGWPNGASLLEQASWQVAQGERVALVGPSGIGKSTVSALVQAQLQPLSGQVSVFGLSTGDSTPASITSQLAVVEQRTYLFNGSIGDNLRLADVAATDQQLYEALDLANLGDEVRAFPLGLHTQVGDHGTRLSGGQSQRLAIARAFLKKAPILILDEPTSQVDLSGEALILQAIERVSQGRTVLMIAHRRAAIEDVDRVLEISQRKVVAVSE